LILPLYPAQNQRFAKGENKLKKNRNSAINQAEFLLKPKLSKNLVLLQLSSRSKSCGV